MLSLFLASAMAFTLVGCGSKTAENKKDNTKNNTKAPVTGELVPEKDAKLVVWESQGAEGEFMQYVADEFAKKYADYNVEVTYEEVGSVDAASKLVQDGPAGVGPDVFAAPHDHIGNLVVSGLIEENKVSADRVNNDYVDAAKTAVTLEDKVWGFPTAIETYGLFYNKAIFPEAPKTYEEIIAKAKDFNNAKENKYAFMWDVGNAYFSHSFITGPGGYVFGKGGTDKNDIGLNNAGAISGAKQMLELKEILPLNSLDSTGSIIEGLFDEGKVGAMINGPWAVSGRKDSGVDFGVAPLPMLEEGKHPSSFSGIRSLFVSYYAKYPNAAQLFAEFATSDEMLLKRFEMTKQIPPVKALMDAEQIKGDEFVAPFLEQAQYAVPMPSIPEMQLVWTPYGAAFSTMWNDGIAPEEALNTAVETIKDAIEAQQ